MLIVDDQRDSRELITVSLARYGADVRECATVREAMQAVQKWQPAIILSDIGMPDEDGYDLIRQVRELSPEEGGTVPALAFTGYASLTDESKALSAGYQVHMPKPLDIDELPVVVAKLISNSKNKKGEVS